jgi:hypothetical protein
MEKVGLGRRTKNPFTKTLLQSKSGVHLVRVLFVPDTRRSDKTELVTTCTRRAPQSGVFVNSVGI